MEITTATVSGLEPLLSIEELSEYLNVSVRTLWNASHNHGVGVQVYASVAEVGASSRGGATSRSRSRSSRSPSTVTRSKHLSTNRE